MRNGRHNPKPSKSMASETRSRRREILSQHWTADTKYVDPLMSCDGLEGVDALMADESAHQ